MKTLTPSLLRYAIVAVLVTFSFRVILSALLQSQQFNFVIPLAILFAVIMFMAGRYYGRKDVAYLPIFDIGFRFHLATFLQFHLVSFAWQLFGRPSGYERISTLYWTFVYWGLVLAIHFYYYRQVKKSTIKNIHRDDLFE
ncbi:hypothetical protein [Sphingobacterium deserti]|uniref:Uncharacterized protein n=1 Tax=Sphingobacterium deserti TaxID=1229276 RepID=A0A0B8T5M3_9SPHI|nr:hypothetical protein [Sphingobacterium deserti]KGE15943.1 hypothetical protein DI53_0292 [Sphingobacterium deserti]